MRWMFGKRPSASACDIHSSLGMMLELFLNYVHSAILCNKRRQNLDVPFLQTKKTSSHVR